MSTKSSIYYHSGEGDHKIDIHIYKDMHQAQGTMVVDIRCSTCYCNYSFLMDEHLGQQLADMLEKGTPEG